MWYPLPWLYLSAAVEEKEKILPPFYIELPSFPPLCSQFCTQKGTE